MITLKENASLATYSTMGTDVYARYLARVSEPDDFKKIITDEQFADMPWCLLGLGSNTLFVHDFDGLVIVNETRGMTENIKGGVVEITAASGEPWHELVMYTVGKGWHGLENLALIPGTVGAAPIQNIGAYGVEQSDTFVRARVLETTRGEIRTLEKDFCHFGYRESIFKQNPGRYIILDVTYALTVDPKPTELETSYGSLKKAIEAAGLKEPNVADIARVVSDVRRTRLAYPPEFKTAGSFFKNPSIDRARAQKIQRDYPDMPTFDGPRGSIKLSAGWLIEQAGYKGFKKKGVGTHPDNALALVNYDHGDGERILDLASSIFWRVKELFGIKLEPEARVIGSIFPIPKTDCTLL